MEKTVSYDISYTYGPKSNMYEISFQRNAICEFILVKDGKPYPSFATIPYQQADNTALFIFILIKFVSNYSLMS